MLVIPKLEPEYEHSYTQSMHQLRYHVQLQIRVQWKILYEATFVRVDYFLGPLSQDLFFLQELSFYPFLLLKEIFPGKVKE